MQMCLKRVMNEWDLASMAHKSDVKDIMAPGVMDQFLLGKEIPLLKSSIMNLLHFTFSKF